MTSLLQRWQASEAPISKRPKRNVPLAEQYPGLVGSPWLLDQIEVHIVAARADMQRAVFLEDIAAASQTLMALRGIAREFGYTDELEARDLTRLEASL